MILCVANHLLDIAGLRSSNFVVRSLNRTNPDQSRPLFEVPMQSSATNAALAIQARQYAGTAEAMALQKIANATNGSCNSLNAATAQAIASTAADALRTYEQGVDVAINNILAVSDARSRHERPYSGTE
jgi:predicted Na+-dependent transporter